MFPVWTFPCVCTWKGFCFLPSSIFISREGFSGLHVASINNLDARMHPMVVVKGKMRQSLKSFQQLMVLRVLAGHSRKKPRWLNKCSCIWESVVWGGFSQTLWGSSSSAADPWLPPKKWGLGLLQMAKPNGIHILAIPSHTTAFFLVLCLGPNKVCWEYLSKNLSNLINKTTLPALFSSASESSVTITLRYPMYNWARDLGFFRNELGSFLRLV